MRKNLALLVVLVLVGSAANAASQTQADLNAVRTLAHGLAWHESSIGPLTASLVVMCQYTPRYWQDRPQFAARPDLRRERSAVALAFRESTQTVWELHAQGLMRGYSRWIEPGFAAETRQLSDLYRVEVSDGANVYSLSRANLGPVLHVRPLGTKDIPQRIRSELGAYFGLAYPSTPLSELLANYMGDRPERKITGVGRGDNDTYVVSMAFDDAENACVWLTTLWLDSQLNVARGYQKIVVSADPGLHSGTATRVLWDDFRPLGRDDRVQLPWQATIWQYHDDGVCDDPLECTESVRVKRLQPTDAADRLAFPVWLPVGTVMEPRTRQHAPDLAGLPEATYGRIWDTELQEFRAGDAQLPPSPPGVRDALRLAVVEKKLPG